MSNKIPNETPIVEKISTTQETQGKSSIAQIFGRIFTGIGNAWKTMVSKLTFPASLEKRSAETELDDIETASPLAEAKLTTETELAADPATKIYNAFKGLSSAHSSKYMNFPEMKKAITEQCDVLLAMFDSNPDLVAENFAEQCKEDGGMDGNANVGMMLALMIATPEGCKLLAKIADHMEQGKFWKIFHKEPGAVLKPTLSGAFDYIGKGAEPNITNSAAEVFDLSQDLKQNGDYVINFNCIACALGLGQLQLPYPE
jgi:hypothetical protein